MSSKYERKYVGLKAKADKWREDCLEAEERCREAEEELSVSLDKLEKAYCDNKALASKLSERPSREKHCTVEKECADLRKQNEQLLTLCEQLKRKASEADPGLDEELRDLRRSIREKEKANEQLERALSRRTDRIEDLEEKLADEKQKYQQLKSEYRDRLDMYSEELRAMDRERLERARENRNLNN